MFGKINKGNHPLLAVLGEGEHGEGVTLDLSQHSLMLISGTQAGSGYLVGGNALITSIMACYTPDQVNFSFIDPSYTSYEFDNSPFLDPQAVHDSKETSGILRDTQESISYLEWVWKEKNRRMELLFKYGVSLSEFNEGVDKKYIPSEKIKHLLVVIDQYSTLNRMSRGKADELIKVIGARDTKDIGIHVIISSHFIDELKDSGVLSLITSRWIFRMRNSEESEVVLGVQGAEKLRGYGDSYLYQEGDDNLTRLQASFTIKKIIKNSWNNGLIANTILWSFYLILVCSLVYMVYGIFEWFI